METLGSTPPPPPLPPPAQPVMVTVPTLGRVLRSAATPLIGYALAVATSLVLMALLVLAIAVQSDGGGDGDPSSDIDIEAITTLVGIPFQITGMALGGSVGLGDADFRLSLFAPPLLVTAIFVAGILALSRRGDAASPSASTTERAILATSGALATAVVAVVVTRALAMRDDGIAMHAATVGLFLGTFLLAAIGGFAGRQAAHRSLWPRALPADVRRALHLVLQHVTTWVVVLVPVATVWLLVDSGPDAALYALVWGPTVALGAFAMGHGGALAAGGEHSFAWDLGWFPGIALPAIAVVLALVAAIAWHLRRGGDREWLAQPTSWVSLPATYALAALLVCLLSSVRISGVFYGEGGGVTFSGAYWLIPVLAIWGAAVEALSRFLAPALASTVPERVTRRLARGPAHLVSPPAPPTQHLPMSPADRARAKRGLITVGLVGGVGILGVVVVSAVGSSLYSPEKRAEAYLDALVDADVVEALDLAPVDGDEASDALMTDDAYAAAAGRITGYEITEVETQGDTATVTVDLEGPEDPDDVQLTLTADGHKAVFFRDWKVDDGGLAVEVTVSVPEASSSVVANGVSVATDGGQDATFWVLPGTYEFDVHGDSRWLEAEVVPTVVPASESWGLYAETGSLAPSQALKDEVDTAIEDWVTTCMASKELDPADCPQDAIGYGDDARKVAWTLTTMPTVSWEYFDGTFPVQLSSDSEGSAKVTYEYDASYGFGAPDWTKQTEEDDLYLNVTVDLVGDEPVVSFETY